MHAYRSNISSENLKLDTISDTEPDSIPTEVTGVLSFDLCGSYTGPTFTFVDSEVHRSEGIPSSSHACPRFKPPRPPARVVLVKVFKHP